MPPPGPYPGPSDPIPPLATSSAIGHPPFQHEVLHWNAGTDKLSAAQLVVADKQTHSSLS
eukprot:6408305-Prymnesium_polylepis.1